MSFFFGNKRNNLIEAEWHEDTRRWTVWARPSDEADWDSFCGAEDELAQLLALAHDYATGG